MKKIFITLLIISSASCQLRKSAIEKHVEVKVSRYEYNNEMMTSALPEIKTDSDIRQFERRFSYLLMNVPELHRPEKHPDRKKLNDFYPDTFTLKKLYLEEYKKDKKLKRYFEETLAPIDNPKFKPKKLFTVEELMEVASKFFFCDLVRPDSTVQAHVCIGLNGIKEANWETDYTLLEAFCYEAIFFGLNDENSKVWDSFGNEKKEATAIHRSNITSLDQYLEDVKLEVFERMRNNKFLKEELLSYYHSNQKNLAFRLKY
jgi:hypothetical protein